MKLADVYAPQLEREAAISRRVLERVPEGRPDWKPHDKSMPLGYLANLVATMPAWVAMAIEQDELNLTGGFQPPDTSSREKLLKAHEEALARARAALGSATDALLATTWRLIAGGRVVLEDPRHVVIEDTIAHLAHHRGQLSVYLRLNDVPVPSLYGPTADEPAFGTPGG